MNETICRVLGAALMIMTAVSCAETSGDVRDRDQSYGERLGYSERERAYDERYRSAVPATSSGTSFGEDVRRGVGVYDTTHPDH